MEHEGKLWSVPFRVFLVSLVLGWGTAAIVTQNLPTDADKRGTLVTREATAPAYVVDVPTHGRLSLASSNIKQLFSDKIRPSYN